MPAQCHGCGTCCRQGGPALHGEDMDLVRKGVVHWNDLVTLRCGEAVHNQIEGTVQVLTRERIKIAGTGEQENPWRCHFHTEDQRCSIYEERPAQCRALFCEDTSGLEALYRQGNLLQRADLLEVAPAGWKALAQAHEEQCSLPQLIEAAFLVGKQAAAAARVLEVVRYDLAFRDLCRERAGIPEDALPCVLGRPVHRWLEDFGLAVIQGRDGLCLERRGISRFPRVQVGG